MLAVNRQAPPGLYVPTDPGPAQRSVQSQELNCPGNRGPELMAPPSGLGGYRRSIGTYSRLSHNAYGQYPNIPIHYEKLCISRWSVGCKAPIWYPSRAHATVGIIGYELIHYEIVDCNGRHRRTRSRICVLMRRISRFEWIPCGRRHPLSRSTWPETNAVAALLRIATMRLPKLRILPDRAFPVTRIHGTVPL